MLIFDDNNPMNTFGFEIFRGKKQGLFDFQTGFEMIKLRNEIPGNALLVDVFLDVLIPGYAGEDPSDTKIEIGIDINTPGYFVGRKYVGGSEVQALRSLFENAIFQPGKQFHVSGNMGYGSGLIDIVNLGTESEPKWFASKRNYFFNGSGMTNFRLDMSGQEYDNKDFEIDVCFLCLVGRR